MTRAAIIVRLSREDIKQPGSTEEKVARHLAIAQELARRHGLPEVCPPDIYTESGVSGSRLSKRPAMLLLLDRCRSRYYSHVVTAYQSRILRGDKRDEADVEDAFLDGEVSLITSEGVIDFDETYEASSALLFEIRAAADRNYLRDVSKKLRESNRQRTLLGQRSAGIAPYGYVWKVSRYEDRKLIDPAHYEIIGDLEICDKNEAEAHSVNVLVQTYDPLVYLALGRRISGPEMGILPGLKCISGEYAILCEIFARIRSEGYVTLCRSLNERSIPTPSARRYGPDHAAASWGMSALRGIVNNLHYSGFPSHTQTTDRRGRHVRLPAERHILPAEEQPWPHPLRLPDQRALLEQIAARGKPGAPRIEGQALLTGVVTCALGQPCRSGSHMYGCQCRTKVADHPGSQIRQGRLDPLIPQIFQAALAALPSASTPPPASPDHATEDLIRLDRELSTKRKDLTDLRRHAAAFSRSGGAEAFAAAIQALQQEIDTKEREYRGLSQREDLKQRREALTVLDLLRGVDFEEMWSAASVARRRSILRLVIAEIRLVAPPSRQMVMRRAQIIIQPWIRPYYDPGTIEIPIRR